MQGVVRRVRQVDWVRVRRDGHNLFTKLIRTRDPRDSDNQELAVPGRQRLERCLTTTDLTSLGVGSCVGTGMYLVSGMVARKFAGPGVIFSFIIAAVASIFSGACYAEFGVRVPNTTGSAYMYSYVTVGEFVAFVIGWNMVLEYLIGTSACARALSACFDSLCDGAISRYLAKNVGTVFGKPPDFVAFGISIGMTLVLVAGVKKSLFFNNVLNAINLSVWVFIMTAGLFYVDLSNWTEQPGFLPFGWTGVFSGAATCFYAFIGFDIIATTGMEANNPKRSIPLAIVLSLGIILLAYVSSSMMLTLIVPSNEVDTDSALVQMFSYVHAPTCKYIVAIGALAGLTVSMFGSMFPMPRVVYAMALDGLIFKQLAIVSEITGTPALATICGGIAAAFVALMVQLEVLVEMMSIGTLLAYTLVSTCVLVLRYQPHSTNLIELLPQSLRTPVDPEGTASANRETSFTRTAAVLPSTSQHVMVRRVTRSSPDSDESVAGDESEEYGRDDAFLIDNNAENKFYGAVPGGSGSNTMCTRFCDAVYRQVQARSYMCPGLFPWVDPGPPTEQTGYFVIKAVGVMYVIVVTFDLIAAYGTPGSIFNRVMMTLLFIIVIFILLLISRKPQNRQNLIYATPGVPFVPSTAILVNIYLILNLSVLTLVRFTIWMTFGLVMYFKYGIRNSTLETHPPLPPPPTPPRPNVLERTTLPPPDPQPSRPTGDRNIFEGDGNNGGLYGNFDYGTDPLLAWHETELHPVPSGSRVISGTIATPYYSQVETRYNERTNRTTSHTSRRPPWAYPDSTFDSWRN
ncbi:solute carrier family 7 member 14 [Plodia interpunctella]|uniref:solute carrier family 7 member 14 n=1 Tax=Plodia interpunctella TaxID=58824 RepID=UPI0023680188|nr:probable cationic amino acid transporter [Plodia interpunctella]XP_053624374.1 probable cationic amino acid transporter [Plodia interpunctella]